MKIKSLALIASVAGILSGGAASGATLTFNNGAATEESPGLIYRYENVVTSGPTTYDLLITFLSFHNGAALSNTPEGLSNALTFSITGSPVLDPYVVFSLSLVEDDTLTPGSLPTEWVTFDIDSNLGEDFTDVFGVTDAVNAPTSIGLNPGTYLENAGFANGNGPVAGYDEYRMDPTSFGAPQNWLDEPNNVNITVPFTDQEFHSVLLSYDSFSTSTFVWGFTGSEEGVLDRAIALRADAEIFVVPEASAALIAGVIALGTVISRRRPQHQVAAA